ncbi:Uncharacterised protein [Mycobacteroides abscessus subsp. abscessus]|nr:Uncharacterised protein [Mycobacteroides abscessus subsp. abscessus]
MILNQQGSRLDAQHQEGPQQDCSCPGSRNTEAQKRDESSSGCCIIGCFRSSQPSDGAFPEFFRLFRKLFFCNIADERSDSRPCSRKDAEDETQYRLAGHRSLHLLEVFPGDFQAADVLIFR